MNNLQNNQKSDATPMGYDTLLAPVSRNYLRRGDKVRMKDGEILTVRSLEFREFCAEEKVGYIPKKDIDAVVEQMGANVLHKTSKGMREMSYQDTQHFERATMLKLPIQPLLVLCGVMGCRSFTI